jgi:hypothetical protein
MAVMGRARLVFDIEEYLFKKAALMVVSTQSLILWSQYLRHSPLNLRQMSTDS